ncbi:helix-turn-helix transcriptional regulator [Luteimonas sp. MC1825]|uniref:helix-turn-helix transcriptional regulator n=1 Tax=Luteimonas sp. MC1825 TaxID=2761107 RepID=UPI00160A7B9E|nr:helix-turn-helix transcriptional regulator [Luteimonas sp. MC1825]MBB6599062.1 helix-turn-helix transcriptional regulator [Luteimonas sp. MC1825]QOC89193.1 helix-turn-helix transcriptional regulator [Luteimonas sp. MC1825]
MDSYTDRHATIQASLLALGERLAQLRLARNLTQAALAREAGTSASSIKRLEAGANASLDTLLRVLQVLGLDGRLLDSLPAPGVRPVERARLGGRERRRASTPAETPKATDWAWGEDDSP